MMNITDLQNLVILARKGMSVLSDQMMPDHATAGWQSIKNAETLINEIKQSQQVETIPDDAKVESVPVDDTNVEVVKFNDVKKEKTDKNSSEKDTE